MTFASRVFFHQCKKLMISIITFPTKSSKTTTKVHPPDLHGKSICLEAVKNTGIKARHHANSWYICTLWPLGRSAKIIQANQFGVRSMPFFYIYILFWSQITTLLHNVNTQYLHFRSCAEYFLLSWKILEVISRLSILFHN